MLLVAATPVSAASVAMECRDEEPRAAAASPHGKAARPLADEKPADEIERERRFRRARSEHETARTKAARSRWAEEDRLREVTNLGAVVSKLGQRESYLYHEVSGIQRDLDNVSRDPADLSSVARRSNLGHELHYLRNELDFTVTTRYRELRRLDELIKAR